MRFGVVLFAQEVGFRMDGWRMDGSWERCQPVLCFELLLLSTSDLLPHHLLLPSLPTFLPTTMALQPSPTYLCHHDPQVLP